MNRTDPLNQIINYTQLKLLAVNNEDYSNALTYQLKIDVLHQQLKKNSRNKSLPIIQDLDKREELLQKIREAQSLKISSYKRDDYILALQYKRQLEKLQQELRQVESAIANYVVQPQHELTSASAVDEEVRAIKCTIHTQN